MLKIFRNLFYLCIAALVIGVVVAYIYAKDLEKRYNLSSETLDGAIWSMPARVYARPMELYQGAPVSAADLENELQLLGFELARNAQGKAVSPVREMQYAKVSANEIIYYAPEFTFWDKKEMPRKITVRFNGGRVSSVENSTLLEEVALERLNPLYIASIYPKHGQDRLLVRQEDVPPLLVDTLLALEDKRFYSHPGIDIQGLGRSLYIAFVAGGRRQGASTLTQQFIKNHYLTNERTISRKLKEMLMALMLERHASKKQILEGYMNEIYLGQDGSRAIHGFGLASEYYFNKKLADLNLHEIAMLLALVRAPGIADPRSHPEAALQRRNFILEQMVRHNLISNEDMRKAQSLPLDVVDRDSVSDRIKFPEFMDLVFKQLDQHYSKEDLTREGLNIFTTLDPQVQQKAQLALSQGLETLPKGKVWTVPASLKGKRNQDIKETEKRYFLQGAALVVHVPTGEVPAVIGSRVKNTLSGYNRAIQTKRQAGSIVKPAVYLSALEFPQLFSLAKRINGTGFNYKGWKPKNASRVCNGTLTLQDALVNSCNVITARIAVDPQMGVGIEDVVSTMKRLGMWSELSPYPSVALGAIATSPWEMAQMYETLANKGYYTPLRSIREITTKEGVPVKRFEMENKLAIMPAPHYLLVSTMQEIPKRGTAKSMNAKLKAFNVAGKTGTTNDNRDSWFAGFTGNYLTVAWVGNDQNKPVGLTGARGAMKIWERIMATLPNEKLELTQPDDIIFKNVNSSGLLPGMNCGGGRRVPFIVGSEPTHYGSPCVVAPPEPVYDDGPSDGGFVPFGDF